MNQFMTLLICLIGMPMIGFLVYTSLERFMSRLNDKEEIKSELNRLNQLAECSSCGRLSRTYQRELARYDLLFNRGVLHKTELSCPHCKKESDFLPITVNLSFHDTHLDCLSLQKSEYTEFKKQREQYEELLYLSKVDKSFKNKIQQTESDC
ncbi:hypothetical protein [Pseudobacillus wudalianchiensis]|uniref:Uncharacterized protein n=1 Tax=Pseudobacillus wudalianchiensis TaxID=1743143 RepID=A0A1B9AAH4_9BACI|nr:hypothetical protein [Bacillus wudalianchiensis]OCA80837.1 hypothetical protein A8F95_17155 [Bacillus wudalianchiensis]